MAAKITELREQLAEKHRTIEKVLNQARSGDTYDFREVTVLGDDLTTQQKVDAFRALDDEAGELTEKIFQLEMDQRAEAATRVREEMKHAASDQKPRHPAPEGARNKSLGDRVVDSEEFKGWIKDKSGAPGVGMQFDDIELKTLMTTTAGWAPESLRIGRVVEDATRPIQVLDLIPMANTNQSSIVYMEETTRTHAAAETAEGAAFPEAAFALTERSSQVRKIATSVPVTDEQLEDVDQVRSYLDQRLRFGLRQRLDNQVLNGNGTAPNLEGILNVTGIQTQAKGTDPTFDAVHKAMTLIRVTGRANPNAIILHPNDWEEIRLTRTADGLYILANPAVPGPMQLFGLPVALSDAIAEGTGLVGDFANFCSLFDRRGIEVQVGFVGTQFTEGEQTIRADMRVAFVVFRPEAFATVTGI